MPINKKKFRLTLQFTTLTLQSHKVMSRLNQWSYRQRNSSSKFL